MKKSIFDDNTHVINLIIKIVEGMFNTRLICNVIAINIPEVKLKMYFKKLQVLDPKPHFLYQKKRYFFHFAHTISFW